MEIKYSKKYHMVRFFERKNIARAIKKLQAEMQSLSEGDGMKKKELVKKLAGLNEDLE